MIRVLVGVGAVALALSFLTSVSCSAVRDRISSAAKGTPSATNTPRPTSTATPTRTPTPIPTPTFTPTPSLPPNPQALSRWEDFPVLYCISSGDDGYVARDEFIAVTDRAFQAWGVPFADLGPCGPVNPQDGVNEIGWGDLSADAQPGRLYEAGLTQTTTSECTAGCNPNRRIHIKEADITIDTSPPQRFANLRCLYGTMLHEVGHFLGLEHLSPPAIMAAQTSGCPGELTSDDRDALIARYGALAGG